MVELLNTVAERSKAEVNRFTGRQLWLCVNVLRCPQVPEDQMQASYDPDLARFWGCRLEPLWSEQQLQLAVLWLALRESQPLESAQVYLE